MGSLFFKDKDSGNEVPITAVREMFKEPIDIAHSDWKKIYAMSVFQRDIEFLNKQSVVVPAATPTVIPVPLPDGIPEDLCGIKLRAYSAADPPVPEGLGSWSITVVSFNGTLVTTETFNLVNVNGIMNIKFTPRFVTAIYVNITSAVPLSFILETHGRRCYNQEAYIEGAEITAEISVDAPESEPLNVQTLNEMVLEDVENAVLDSVPVLTSTIAALFDKDNATFYTLGAASELVMKLKKAFNIKRLKFYGADLELTPDLTIMVTYEDGTTETWDATGIVELDTAITAITLTNGTLAAIDIYEIIGELFQHVEAFQQPITDFFKADQDDVALTDEYVFFPFINPITGDQFKSVSFDLSNDDDTGYIEWSWDGVETAGKLLKGETYHEVATQIGIWLRGEAGGELYRVWARGNCPFAGP